MSFSPRRLREGFSESSEKVYSSLQNVPREDRWKELVRLYLSPEHCDHPDTGCPVAALAPEIARAKFSVRKRISGLMKDRTERWVEFMPGRTAAERERNFFVIFSCDGGCRVRCSHSYRACRQAESAGRYAEIIFCAAFDFFLHRLDYSP